jgi:hypothetical protein
MIVMGQAMAAKAGGRRHIVYANATCENEVNGLWVYD